MKNFKFSKDEQLKVFKNELHIMPVSNEVAGDYQCRVTNKLNGQVRESDIFELLVVNRNI
jgi:hypothetical protein